MNRHRPRAAQVLRSLLATSVAVSWVAHAAASPIDAYVAAVQLARAGSYEEAFVRLEPLALENRSSVPIQRGLALAAHRSGRADAARAAFEKRLRGDRRDTGAMVGLATLALEGAARTRAQQLLRRALESGERSPLLARLLLDSAVDRDGLVRWLGRESARHPRDPLLAAIEARVLFACGRVARARGQLEAAMQRGLVHPDVLALHASILRAAGREKDACEQAALAGTGLQSEAGEAPEIRVPRRLAIARVLAACGRAEPARRLVAAVGPLVNWPDDPPLRPQARVVEAEIQLARTDPLGALVLLEEAGDVAAAGAETSEAAAAVAAGAHALLGTAPAGPAPPGAALPEGLALADRSIALAARVLGSGTAGTEELAEMDRVAQKLEHLGLATRAGRLLLLAADVRAASSASDARSTLRRALAWAGPSAAPEIRAGAAVVRTHLASAVGEPRAVLREATPDALERAGWPAALRVVLRAAAARAALAAGDPDAALVTAREGLLEAQEADRAEYPVPPELAPLAAELSDRALELAGLAFRAATAAGKAPAEAQGALLRDLGRVTRGWALVGAGWPTSIGAFAGSLPPRSCLVVAASGRNAPALALGGEIAEVATASRALHSRSCESARTIFWAGPAAPGGGLFPGPGDERLLVRLVALGPPPLPGSAPPATTPGVPLPLGAGAARPLREIAERLAGPPPVAADAAPPGNPAESWVVFGGAGLAPARAPLASGWLVPPGAYGSPGWLGAETLQLLSPVPGSGLVATGVRALPDGAGVEKGLWVLAQSGLQAGWRWALISRQPLSPEQSERLRARLKDWPADPLKQARRLARSDPGLAGALTLWTMHDAARARDGAMAPRIVGISAAGIALGALAGGACVRRGRRACRPSRRRRRSARSS
ncbi:MAG: hypothetical protein KBD01_17580 [Acidobacteria bacterium]|nr:hypothetical protein [Acidobacteriota bacterium]